MLAALFGSLVLIVAVIAALGAILAPQDLADISASGSEAVSLALPTSLSVAEDAGHGAMTTSMQSASGRVSDTRVEVSGEYRTGDILMDANSVGSGIQAYNLNTGIGSLGQANISIAAGALNFGAQQK